MIHLKTSDLAICAEVSQFMIRDYSDAGLLGPIMRSKSSSYRSFDLRHIPQMYLVKTLREMGFMPQEIKDYAQNRTPESAAAMFRDCAARLADEIALLQARHDMLQSHASLIEEGRFSRPGEIGVRELGERPVRRSSLENISGKRRGLDRLRQSHSKIRYHGNPGCPLGFAYNDFLDLLEQPDQPAQLMSFDPQGPDVLPAGDYLVGTVNCCYSEKNGLPQRMFNHALQNGLKLHGPAYSVYLLDAASVTESEKFLLQVAVEVI